MSLSASQIQMSGSLLKTDQSTYARMLEYLAAQAMAVNVRMNIS